jgi:sulfur carrier protein
VTEPKSVVVNGVPRTMAVGTTVDEVVALVSQNTRGVAVAVNGEVVPKSAWVRTTVGSGDTVEVLTAAQGG